MGTGLFSRSNIQDTKRALLLAALGTAFACAGPMQLAAQVAPTQAEENCAGFFSKMPLDESMIVAGSEEVAYKNEFTAHDYVYLSKGRDAIHDAGGQYLVVRPVTDVNRKEIFPGQHHVIEGLGTLYAEIGRVEIAQVHEHSSTAHIVYSCESMLTGDVVIPYIPKPLADYRPSKFTDRWAAPSGKAIGIIVASKDFDHWVGESRIMYVNLGSAQGLKTGSYLRIVRDYKAGGNMAFSETAEEFPTDIDGQVMSRKLSHEEEATLPRETLGEAMVLTTDADSATAIITYTRTEVAVGDSVELE